MKYIKKYSFEQFGVKKQTRLLYFKENFNIEQHRYLDLEELENGDLKIILNSDGREEVKYNGIDSYNFSDYFDDIRANSEYLYWESISDAKLGMSDAPCITNGYYVDDIGNLMSYGLQCEIFYYPDYMVKDFTKELVENNFVIFKTTTPKTQEEINRFRLKKDVEKYNL
jgi:hypothetical protein